MFSFSCSISVLNLLPGIHVFQQTLKSNLIIDMFLPRYLWLILVNIDGASWLDSVLFCVLKAVHGLLATLDSIGHHNYS